MRILGNLARVDYGAILLKHSILLYNLNNLKAVLSSV